MSEVPKRHIVTEAFVHQLETIEKTSIEAQNQPSSYYTRRSRRDQQQPLVAGLAGNNYHGKYGYYGNNLPMGMNMPVPNGSSVANPNLMPVDVYGYRNNNSMAGMSGLGTGSGLSGVPLVPHVPQIFDDQDSKFYSAAAPLMASVSTGGTNAPAGGLNGLAATATGGSGSSAPAYKPSGGLSTFDPFCDNKEAFTPLFTSSNNSVFGSNFATSSNIWGDTNKTDAAVWG